MVTLSAGYTWLLGARKFILEPLEEQPSSLELGARVRYMPWHFENPRELGIDVDPASVEITSLKNNERLVDSETSSSHGWTYNYIQDK